MSYSIGVDSGGTHVVASGYNENKEKISNAVFGPGNIFINPAQAVANISQAINQASISNEKCNNILIGIAGLESAVDTQRYLQEIKNKINLKYKKIVFTSDAKLALINGLEGSDGFLAIAGTGSIVYGKQKKRYSRIGGWGYLLDDVCSGYRIVQEAVSYLLNEYDLGRECPYKDVVFNYFNSSSIHELVSKYYQSSRDEISNCAKFLAENEDQEISKIFTHQGALLAGEICNLINKYSSSQCTYKLALSGSVLVKNKTVQKEIKNKVLKEFPQTQIIISTRNNNAAVNYI